MPDIKHLLRKPPLLRSGEVTMIPASQRKVVKVKLYSGEVEMRKHKGKVIF